MLKNGMYLILLFMLLIVAGCGDSGSASAVLVSIALDSANPSLAVGANKQFTADGTYSDSTTKDLTSSVTWKSSDTTVATVGTSGLATPVAAGSTTITAILGDIAGSTMLTVTPVPTPDPINGANLYAANCAACHNPLAAASISPGATAAQIQMVINSGGEMSILSFLTIAQIRDIAAALAAAD